MTVVDELREAFATAGYEVGEASRNRDRVRVEVTDDEASASDLRAIVTETLGEGAVLGLNVEAEAGSDETTIGTVVSFRYRG